MDTAVVDHLNEEVINIIDVEDTKMSTDNANNYVYDLYYTQALAEKNVFELDNILSIAPIDENLVFEDCYKDTEQKYSDDSEDSNCESYWKNDYPDSDHSDGSIRINDIRSAMQNMNVEDDLSSDSEDFVYGLDEDIVERYGFKYAKYRERIKKELEDSENSKSSNSDESSIEKNQELDDTEDSCDNE